MARSARWHISASAEHAHSKLTTPGHAPPIKISSRYGKTPTPVSPSCAKPNPNPPSCNNPEFSAIQAVLRHSFRYLLLVGQGNFVLVVSILKVTASVCSNSHRAQRIQPKVTAAQARRLTVGPSFHLRAIFKLKSTHSRSSQEPVLQTSKATGRLIEAIRRENTSQYHRETADQRQTKGGHLIITAAIQA
jgi:hypothetical protein